MARSALIASTLLVCACTLQRTQPPQSSTNSAVPDEHMAHMAAADMRAPAGAAGAVIQDRAGLPPSANSAEARLKSTPRHAEWVKIAWEPGSADSLMAWVVYPTSANARAKAPVIVVVHEIFGLSTWVRGVADQVAADGFIAIAPDFLSRVRGGATTVELSSDSARKIIGGVSAAEKNRAINAAASYAMMLPSAAQKYGIIGFCWGGTTVFQHAINGGVKGFSGGVAFYGLPYMVNGTPATATSAAVPATINADSVAKIKVPVMLLNGSKDARIAAAMPALDSIMKALKKDYSGTNYEGAVHGFVRAQDDPAQTPNPAEEAANLAATKDAWPKMIAFMRKNLK